jgi:hypothetical protein
MRPGQSNRASSSQITALKPLCMRGLNPRSHGILLPKLRSRLPVLGSVPCLVGFSFLQDQFTRSTFRSGATGAQRTGRAITAGKLNADATDDAQGPIFMR